jgi:hypothetical protein
MAYDVFSGEIVPKNFARASSMGADDPYVWTATATDAELGRILALIDNVNLQMSQAVTAEKATTPEWQSWKQFYTEAHKFLTRASSKFFGWGSHVNIARNFEQEAIKWRDLLEARGVKPIGPADQGRSKDKDTFFTALNVGLAVGGVLATSLLITAIKK